MAFFWSWICYRIPVDSIQPMYQEKRMSRNRATDSPMRMVRALTVRLDLLLSFMRKKNADPRLAKMPRKARPIINFMVTSFTNQSFCSTKVKVCHG